MAEAEGMTYTDGMACAKARRWDRALHTRGTDRHQRGWSF